MERLLLLLLWLLPLAAFTQQPYWNWMQTLGGTSDDIARSVVLDPEGRAYVAGYFKGTARFGDQTRTSRSANDLFLACYEADGRLRWVEQAGFAERDDWRVGLAFSPDGGLLLTGSFYGQAIFGTETLQSQGQNDLFIARYTLEGRMEWVRQIAGNLQEWGRGIIAGTDGSFWLTGGFYSTVRFGATALSSLGQNDIFIAAFDRLGNVRWAKRAGGIDFDEGTGIARDAAGNLYITGWYGARADFGPQVVQSPAFFELFVAKYAPDGRELWVRSAQGQFTNFGRQIEFDPATGDLFACGSFSGTVNFWGRELTSQGGQDGLLLRISPDGDVRWARSFGGSEADEAFDLAVGGSGRLYVGGSFSTQARFGTEAVNAAGGSDAYVAAFGTDDGTALWVHRAGGPANDAAHAIASDGLEAQYVAGEVGGPSRWDEFQAVPAGGRDAFLAQLGQLRLAVDAGPGGRRCSEEPFQLQGSVSFPFARVEWSPAAGLSNPTALNPEARPRQTTDYVLTARYGALVARDTVRVESAAFALRQPSIFYRTPTGHGNGTILALGRGGAVPLRFRLDGGPWQPRGRFGNLGAGTYLIEVEDALGCRIERRVDLN